MRKREEATCKETKEEKKKKRHSEPFLFQSVHVITLKQDMRQRHKGKGTLNGRKGLFHGFVAWIMELGGQIKVWVNIGGVILPPLTNTRFQLHYLLLFVTSV